MFYAKMSIDQTLQKRVNLGSLPLHCCNCNLCKIPGPLGISFTNNIAEPVSSLWYELVITYTLKSRM